MPFVVLPKIATQCGFYSQPSLPFDARKPTRASFVTPRADHVCGEDIVPPLCQMPDFGYAANIPGNQTIRL
jgi:hypothetical protein